LTPTLWAQRNGATLQDVQTSFKEKLLRGDLLIGTLVSLPCPEIAEIFCRAGFDWLFVDLEHSALGIRDAQIILQAAAPRVPCLIRVPGADDTWIKKALDTGAEGIIAPMVQTAEQAEMLVHCCRYPPQGRRSVGIARAQRYGPGFQEYVDTANDRVCLIIQIEHIQAVENIEKLLAVPGIDGLFVGPYDLSASMGRTGEVTHPDVEQAIAHVRKYARQAGLPLGIFGASAQAVQPHIRHGFTLIAVGLDTALMAGAAEKITATLKST